MNGLLYGFETLGSELFLYGKSGDTLEEVGQRDKWIRCTKILHSYFHVIGQSNLPKTYLFRSHWTHLKKDAIVLWIRPCYLNLMVKYRSYKKKKKAESC